MSGVGGLPVFVRWATSSDVNGASSAAIDAHQSASTLGINAVAACRHTVSDAALVPTASPTGASAAAGQSAVSLRSVTGACGSGHKNVLEPFGSLVSYMPLGRERPRVKVSNRARCALIGASAQTPQSK